MATAESSRLILFDLDDVFTFTDKHFWYLIEWALLQLRVETNMSPQRYACLLEHFHRLNIELFSSVGVARERWLLIMQQLAPEFPELTEAVQQMAALIFAQIYTAAPALRPYAMAMINQVSLLEYRMGILTHADEAATEVKAKAYGLATWFEFVDSVPPLGTKNAAAWQSCIAKAQTTPDQVLVVEDNRKNILAAMEAGVPQWQIVWHKGAECPPYGQTGEAPDGVHILTDLRQLAPYIQTIWP